MAAHYRVDLWFCDVQPTPEWPPPDYSRVVVASCRRDAMVLVSYDLNDPNVVGRGHRFWDATVIPVSVTRGGHASPE